MKFSIADIKDWQSLKQGVFRKKMREFNLKDVLEELKTFMEFEAQVSMKNLKITFEPNFGDRDEAKMDLYQMILLEGMTNSLKNVEHFRNHPLLKHVVHVDQTKQLPVLILGDGLRFQQVAMNLISNAIKNTESGEIFVNICFDPAKCQIVFIIADNGRGIKEEDQEIIFQLFSTMLKAENQGKMYMSDGSQIGLGLFISKQIVEQYGGSIDFYSEYHKGSTFIFTFDVELDPLEYQKLVANVSSDQSSFLENKSSVKFQSPRFGGGTKLNQDKNIDALIKEINIEKQPLRRKSTNTETSGGKGRIVI